MPLSLEVPSTAERLRALREAGVLSTRAFDRGLELALGSPSADAWRRFFSRSSLVLGAMLLVSGVVYFFAANWQALPKSAKFAVLELGIAGLAAGTTRLRDGLPRQIALTC